MTYNAYITGRESLAEAFQPSFPCPVHVIVITDTPDNKQL